MKHRFIKKAILMAMVLLLAVNVPSVTPDNNDDSHRVAELKKWYKNYLVNGNTDIVEVTNNSKTGVTHQASFYLGNAVFVAVKNGKKKDESTGKKVDAYVFERISIGYPAHKDGKSGFVTCAHAVKDSNKKLYTNLTFRKYKDDKYTKSQKKSVCKAGYRVGTVYGSCVLDYSIDASFIELNTTHKLVSRTMVSGGNYIYNEVVNVKRGDTIYTCGSVTGVQSAVVDYPKGEIGLEINSPGEYYKDVIIANKAFTRAGDSGGLVYTKSGGKYKIVGIVCGVGNYRRDGKDRTFIISASAINSKLGLKVY